MQEGSTTVIPNANTHRPHVESGVEAMTIEEEAIRANREAERQSSPKKDNKQC